jgi:GntR family transcriptional regulator, trigonelline degradation regulator
MAARACADKGDKAVADGLQAVLDRIRSAYAERRMDGVLAQTTEFYRLLFSGAERDVAWGIVSSLTARINRLRSMTITTPGRDRDGPAQMQRIVDAVAAGDGEAAFRAAQEHVGHASGIARRLLENGSADARRPG